MVEGSESPSTDASVARSKLNGSEPLNWSWNERSIRSARIGVCVKAMVAEPGIGRSSSTPLRAFCSACSAEVPVAATSSSIEPKSAANPSISLTVLLRKGSL